MARKPFLIILLSIVFVGSLFVASHSYAQTADELKSNLDSLTSKIQALDKEIADFNKKISATQGEAKTLKAALASLETKRQALAVEIQRTGLKITQAEGNIAETSKQIDVTTSKLDQNQSALAETLRSIAFEDSGVPPYIQTLSKGAHFSDLVEQLKRSADLSGAINQKVTALSQTKDALATQKTAYESNKQQLENLTETLSDQKQLVEQTVKDKNTLLAQTKNKETEYQKLLADRKVKKNQLEAEMLDVESRLKVVTDASKLPKTGKGVLQYPVAKVNITQTFGTTAFSTANPQVYSGHGHNGIDFAVPSGTAIYAAESGTVVGTGNTDAQCSGVSYGKWVLIRHTNGLTSLYAHLSVIQVSAGQKVTAGQKIALSGNTGYSTGPHLHFTVYASDSVHIAGATEYKSKVCGTYMILPLAPLQGYLNPLSYL